MFVFRLVIFVLLQMIRILDDFKSNKIDSVFLGCLRPSVIAIHGFAAIGCSYGLSMPQHRCWQVMLSVIQVDFQIQRVVTDDGACLRLLLWDEPETHIAMAPLRFRQKHLSSLMPGSVCGGSRGKFEGFEANWAVLCSNQAESSATQTH